MRARALVAAGVLLSGVIVGAQDPPSSGQPTFRAGVELVEVDVIVTDSNGQYIRDLKQADFEVLEQGRRQPIRGFTRIDLPLERFDSPLDSPDPIEPDVVSNDQPFNGRVYVMLIDDQSISNARSRDAKRIADDFVRDHVHANDLMAIVHTAGPADVNQEFTNNKRLLRASVDKTRGCRLPPVTGQTAAGGLDRSVGTACAPDSFNSLLGTWERLKGVGESLASTRGRRKAVLFIGEAVAMGVDSSVPSTAGTRLIGDSVDTQLQSAAVAAIASLQRANASVYSINPTGIRTRADEDIVIAGAFPTDRFGNALVDTPDYTERTAVQEIVEAQNNMRQLAGQTGGFSVMNMNDYGPALARIVDDNSAYYVIAFQPADAKRDGKFHNIDVRVNRPGVTVRARRGYFVPKDTPARPSFLDAKNASPDVRDALNALLPSSGVGLHLSVAAFRAGDEASVLLTAEMPGRDVAANADEQLELAYFAVDSAGRVQDGLTDKIRLRLQPAMRSQVADQGFRVLKRMRLPPGRYQVRMAARSPARGAVGSVIADLEVPDYQRQPFAMSQIVLTSASTSRIPTLRPDEETRRVLPASPTAHRVFPPNDVLALFAEIYDDGRAAPHKVNISTTLRSDDGRVVFKNEDQRDSRELDGTRGGYAYTARVPLTGVAPGAYILALEARSTLGADSASSRQIRITVSAGTAERAR